MKIVKMKGGLGNQLFQYCFACLLRERLDEEVKIDMTSYSGTLDDPIRQPRVLKLSITVPIAQDDEISEICILKHKGNLLSLRYKAEILVEDIINKKYFREKNRSYIDPELIIHHDYYDGYWQSWRYVEEIWNKIENDFFPNYQISDPTQRMINTVKSVNSVFIGIRKGDYSQRSSHYGSFGNEYFQKAMAYVAERVEAPVFYIFSNDVRWVKDNIDFSNRNVVFREPEDIVDDFEELLIMAACRHSIITNSTYHWWGARLHDHPDKIVIAPKKWFFDNKPIDIVCPRWVQIEE